MRILPPLAPLRLLSYLHLLVLTGVALACLPAHLRADQHDWVGASGSSWFTPGNWTGTVGGVPIAGNSIFWGNGTTFDINTGGGTGVSLGSSVIRTNSNQTYNINDTNLGTVDTFSINSMVHDANVIFNVPVTATTLESTRSGYHFNAANAVQNLIIRGQHQDSTEINFAPSITMTLIDMRNTDNAPTDHDDTLHINANVSVTTFKQQHGGLSVGSGATFTIGDWQYTQGDITNSGTIVGTSPSSLPAFQTWKALADGSIPNNPITIQENARMSIGVAQTGTWNNSNLITILPGATLDGNLTNAVFSAGPAQNVAIHGGAIYAPSAGDTLTLGDIVGGGTVIGGALHLRLNSALEIVKGDAAPGPVRGIAVGPFTEYWNNGRIQGTFQLENNTGDMLVYLTQNAGVQGRSGEFFNMIGNAQSTTANIVAQGGSLIWEKLNGNAITNNIANRIDTFNFMGGLGTENTQVLLMQRITNGDDPAVHQSQTLNITDGYARLLMTNNLGANMAGTLSIGDGGGLRVENTDNFSNATGIIEFKSGSALRIFNNNFDVFEDLPNAAQLVVESNPAVAPIFLTADNNIPIPNTATKLLDALEHFNIALARSNNQSIQAFDGTAGLPIGDGQYLMNGNTVNTTLTSATTYFGVSDPANQSMGIAAFNGLLTIDTPTQAGTATLVIGSDTPMTTVLNQDSFERHTGIPGGTVRFLKPITAGAVDVQSGTMRNSISQTLANLHIGAGATVSMDNNITTTVTGSFGGNGNYTGGNGIVVAGTGSLNPGDSIGTITGNSLLLASGATYNWEVADAAGAPGTGWDLSTSTALNVQGSLAFNIVELGFTGEIASTDSFVVAAANSISNFDPNNVVFDVIEDQFAWDLTDAELSQQTGAGAFAGQQVLVLTGVIAQQPSAAAVPEPASVAIWSLLGIGLAVFGYSRRRGKK